MSELKRYAVMDGKLRAFAMGGLYQKQEADTHIVELEQTIAEQREAIDSAEKICKHILKTKLNNDYAKGMDETARIVLKLLAGGE